MAPIINDVATDLVNVPQFVGDPKLNPLPEDFKAQIRQGYPNLKTLVLTGVPKTAAFEACRAAAKKMPRWTMSMEDPDRGILEGYATTMLLRFKDDFTIRVQERDGDSAIDMRSKSRIGKGDLGANAARIQAFFGEVTSTANIKAASV